MSMWTAAKAKKSPCWEQMICHFRFAAPSNAYAMETNDLYLTRCMVVKVTDGEVRFSLVNVQSVPLPFPKDRPKAFVWIIGESFLSMLY